MKKFLAFLLIVAIACTAVEDIDLGNIFQKIWGWIKKAWNWLKEEGILDEIKDTLISQGVKAAVGVCTKVLDISVCEELENSFEAY